jgi:RNA polymerase sigma factor (TIGR02999 family)
VKHLVPRRTLLSLGTIPPRVRELAQPTCRDLLAGARPAILALMSDVTHLLNAIALGDPHAAGQLLPLVYDELRKLASQKLAHEKPGQTLDATSLVHEACLRLLGGESERQFTDRQHFFRVAATAMRRILIDRARRRQSRKHGGGQRRQELDAVAAPQPDEELLALDTALEKLAVADPQRAKLVELRFFAGLTGEQAAEVLGISPATADRWWSYARAWLLAEMQGE